VIPVSSLNFDSGIFIVQHRKSHSGEFSQNQDQSQNVIGDPSHAECSQYKEVIYMIRLMFRPRTSTMKGYHRDCQIDESGQIPECRSRMWPDHTFLNFEMSIPSLNFQSNWVMKWNRLMVQVALEKVTLDDRFVTFS
jgi:hypothetical protein